jgi:hypothetical protein
VPLVEIPVRLASRARLLGADVAAAFAPIVAAVNGTFNASHFAPSRWLGNAFKAAPNSLLPIQINIPWVVATGAKTYLVRVHPSIVAPHAIRWTACQDYALTGALWDGTIKLFRNGVQIGTTQTLVNAPEGVLPIDEALDSAATDDDTTFSVEVNPTNLKGGKISNLTVTVWCKAPHVR